MQPKHIHCPRHPHGPDQDLESFLGHDDALLYYIPNAIMQLLFSIKRGVENVENDKKTMEKLVVISLGTFWFWYYYHQVQHCLPFIPIKSKYYSV